MLHKKSYMKREDIERLIAERVISPEAGAKIMERFGRKAIDEATTGWFWLLPLLGMFLVLFGASTLLSHQWGNLAQTERIAWLVAASVVGVVTGGYAWRSGAKSSLTAETAAAICTMVGLFVYVFGLGYGDMEEPTRWQMQVLSLGLVIPLALQWVFRSITAALLYYVYFIALLFWDVKMLWPFYEAFGMGLLPLGMTYYWYKHSDGVRLMLFNWAFTIAGIFYIIGYFWNTYVGLVLCLATGAFLASFWKVHGVAQVMNAWRVIGIPSVLLGVGVGWSWLAASPASQDIRAALIWFALGLVVITLVFWRLPVLPVVKRSGYAMILGLGVLWLLLWLRSWQFPILAGDRLIVAWDVLAGLQGAWFVSNGLRYRSLFFINLGVLFIMIFTFLLTMTGGYMEASTIGWVLVLEGIAFVVGNILFSKYIRGDREEDDGMQDGITE